MKISMVASLRLTAKEGRWTHPGVLLGWRYRGQQCRHVRSDFGGSVWGMLRPLQDLLAVAVELGAPFLVHMIQGRTVPPPPGVMVRCGAAGARIPIWAYESNVFVVVADMSNPGSTAVLSRDRTIWGDRVPETVFGRWGAPGSSTADCHDIMTKPIVFLFKTNNCCYLSETHPTPTT